MTFVWRTVGLGALVTLVPTLSPAAESAPQGSYQADVLGPVELHSDKDRLVGYSAGGGPCGLQPHQTVLEGQLQGRVMVGHLTVCLQGGGTCPPTQELPVLAFYDTEDKTLATWVRPPEGCRVPRLGTGSADGGVVVLRPAPAPSPADVAASRVGLELPPDVRRERPNAEAAKQALSLGKSAMEHQEWKKAAEAFERSLYHNGDRTDERTQARNWTAYVNLGIAQLMQDQPEKAIWALQKAYALNAKHPHVYNVHYGLACAYSQLHDKALALEQFQLAVDSGLPLSEGAQDRRLDKLLGSDMGSYNVYTQLLQRALDNYRKASTPTRQIPEP